MKLMGVRVLSALSAALLSGCVALEPLPAPALAPDQTVLETRLTGVESRLADFSARLDRLEGAADDLGRRQERRLTAQDRTLAGIGRELKETRTAVTSLRRKLASQPPTAVARPEGATAIDGNFGADYRAVEIALGELPSGEGERLVRRIPAAVPSAAREILVYAQIATGYVEGGPHRFRVSVRLDAKREAAFYLYAVGQPQQGWAYNSDNVWLPMPKNRELILQADGKPFFGDWNSEVRIVGYR